MSNKTVQVLGFIIDKDSHETHLVRKKSPEWQKGFLNGIGGMVLPNETPKEAMNRLALSEVAFPGIWEPFASIVRDDWECKVFYATYGPDEKKPSSIKEELVGKFHLSDVPYLAPMDRLVPGVTLLIHAALEKIGNRESPYVILKMDDGVKPHPIDETKNEDTPL